MKSLNELRDEAFAYAEKQGFHERQMNLGERLMLVVSELMGFVKCTSRKKRRRSVKKVIELLEGANAILATISTKITSLDGIGFPVAISNIQKAIAELKTPRWIPYKNMADALRYMDEAIDAVEEVTFRGRDEEKCIDTALNRIECAKGAVETMIPLPLPRWYTPEQWKERTGEPWPDNGAVYYQYTRDNKYDVWRVGTYKNILYSKRDFELSGAGTHQIICATEAGPPPDGWRP